MEIFQRSDGFFIDGGGVQVVWSVSGRNRMLYWGEYTILGKFPERLEIKIPIAHLLGGESPLQARQRELLAERQGCPS